MHMTHDTGRRLSLSSEKAVISGMLFITCVLKEQVPSLVAGCCHIIQIDDQEYY